MVLPEGLEFLKAGWWLIHVLGTVLVYVYAYRKGRADARREITAGTSPALPPSRRGSSATINLIHSVTVDWSAGPWSSLGLGGSSERRRW
jgi:hypothetical protein